MVAPGVSRVLPSRGFRLLQISLYLCELTQILSSLRPSIRIERLIGTFVIRRVKPVVVDAIGRVQRRLTPLQASLAPNMIQGGVLAVLVSVDCHCTGLTFKKGWVLDLDLLVLLPKKIINLIIVNEVVASPLFRRGVKCEIVIELPENFDRSSIFWDFLRVEVLVASANILE